MSKNVTVNEVMKKYFGIDDFMLWMELQEWPIECVRYSIIAKAVRSQSNARKYAARKARRERQKV